MKMKHKQHSFDQMYKKTLKKTLLVQALSAALGSLNLSNSAAVLLYEAWRQVGFKGGV